MSYMSCWNLEFQKKNDENQTAENRFVMHFTTMYYFVLTPLLTYNTVLTEQPAATCFVVVLFFLIGAESGVSSSIGF